MMKYPPGALLSLATEQYIIGNECRFHLVAFLFTFSYFFFFFLFDHLIYITVAVRGRTNKEPSKPLPRASIQMRSSV